jgi:hypothetical protein
MVPFSFSQPLLKSRVMKEHLTDALDGGINGSMASIIDCHAGLESGAFAFSCLLAFLMVISDCAKICKKPNEFAKIQVNPTKSNQIQPLFLFQLLTPDTLIHDT